MALSEFEKFYNNNKKKEASGLDAFFQNLPKNNPAPVRRQPIQQTPVQPARTTRMSSYLGDKVNDFTRKSDTMYNRGKYNVNAWQKQYEDIVSNIDRQANKYDSSYIDALKERLAQQREKMIPSQLNVPAYKNTGNGYEPANITLNNQNLFKAQEKPFRETTTFDRLMDLAAEKTRNNQMIQDTAYVNASGQGFEGMRDRDIRFYQNMWKQQQDEFGRKASTWNPPKKDSPVNYTGKVDLTDYMTDAEIDEFNKSKDKEKYLRDIGIAQGGIDAIMSDTIKTTGGGSDFATTDYTQDRGPMPRLWQNTGIYGNARNMADLEMRSRDIQRKYVGYTLNPDFDENSRYVPEQVTKDLRQLEAINPEMVNSTDEYNAIRHEAINGNQDAIYYLTHVREAGALDDEYSEDPFVEQYMTDEEREKYNYLWNKPETRPQAIELLDDLNLDLWKRAYYAADEETRARLEKMPGWALVLESGIMAGIGLVENQANAVLAAEDILSGRDINPFRMTNKASITNEVTDTRIRDWAVRNGLGDVGETALSILYQGYYSGLQSTMALGFGGLASDALGLLGQGATQAFSLGLMSTGAGMQTLQQELIAGVPQDRAIVDSIAAGVVEFATEKIGMDNLFTNLINGKSGFIELLKQAFAEGAEELVGDAAIDAFGDIYDLLKNTNYSELNRQANAYLLENGLAPNQRNEAMAHVLAERLQEYATDYAVGFASTGTGEGSFAAISNYNNARVLTGHINERMAPDIFRVAATLDHDSKAYKGAMALQERMMNEFNPVAITPKEVRKVARDIVYEVRSIENDNERQAKEQDMLEAFGISRFLHPDVHTTTEQPRTTNDPNAGEFEVNKTEADAVKAAEDAEQKRIDDATVNDIITDAVNNNTDKDPDEITRKVTAFRMDGNVEEVSGILTQEQIQTVMEISSREGSAEAVQAAVDAIAEEAVPVQREEAPTEAVEEAIEEEPITEQEQPAAEQEQPASEPDTSAFANTLSPKARQAYEETLDEARQNGMSVADATQAFMEVYTAGTHKVSYTPTVNNQKLSPRLRWSIDYAAQQESAEYTANLEQKGFAKSAAPGVAKVETSKGLVATPVLTRAINDGRISQRTADVMNKLGQMLGVRINVLSTNPKYNGEYKAQQADINLYLDARFFRSKTTDEAVIGVLGHELSHRLEDISPEAYRQLTTMVMQTMGSSGFARMVQHNMRLAPGMTILDAQGEVVSDFVGTMLFQDSDFVDRFIGNVQVQTAEQRTALQGLRDFVHKVIDWIRGNKDAFKEPEKTITWMEKLENTLTNLIEQSAAAVGESTNVVEPTVETPSNYEDGIRPSIKSLGDAANIDVQMDEKTGEVYFQIDGKKVTNVSAEHIKSSGIGAMIKLAEQNGNIKPADAKKQYQAFADIMNMVMTTQNPDLVWQYVGAEIFSAVKSNSDNQYGTTVDMSTICKKTQDMITAMSSAMVAAKRGLTISEVTELQNRINNNGMQVPCPVCYVFSRWAGIGSVLDQMYNFQQKYPPEMPMEEIRAAYDRLSKEKAADTKRRLLAEDAAYKDLSDTLAEQRKRKRELGAEIRKTTDQAEKDRLVEERSQVDKLITEYKNMMKAMETAGAEASWLMRTRMSDTYRPVPADILFDLDAGKTLASEYPDSWNFRMTRGAGKGKAILPYSDFRFGALVDGPKNKGRLLERGPEVLKTGEFNKDQMKLIETAMLRTLAQNLIGGQRYQSTSDFRYDYALDYLMSFLEAQALGSNLQTYTKVVEYAELIAAVGGDVNLSVMPLERGYDENGKLTYSSVTGINYDAAVKASHMYDSAQLILVGINDRHIALALADPEIGFVIPWHASGASNDFTSSLLRNLGESYNSDYYQNYEAVQNDHLFYDEKNKRQGTTRDQDYKRDLRKKILTGEALSQGDIDFLEGLNESADITDMTFEELRDIERHALAGNQEALATYLSWSDGILYDLYKKMTSPTYEKVKLSTSQSASVMPHEYWNTDTTLDNAYVNGFIFRSYCHSMGLHPRFTGYNSAGKHLTFGDFSNEVGYWKTLIDRPMYNNDGTYRAQQAVNLNNFQKEMLLPEYRNVNWSEYATNMPDANKAKAVGTEYGESLRSVEARYSVKETDPETIEFLENQEHITTYKAMQLIDGKLYPPMAARTKGEDGKYHMVPNSTIGTWQRAVEDLGNAKFKPNGQAYYVLDKADGTSIEAAYNPYEHSSNLVLNDQFEGAYKRNNLVVVECEIPVSEMDGTYKAEHAKDATGMLDWKAGVVAGKLKDNPRKVYLSRWLKPVRILSDAETAGMWADTLNGTGVKVPFNVVWPGLLSELENAGVEIDYAGSPGYQSRQKRAAEKAQNFRASMKNTSWLDDLIIDDIIAEIQKDLDAAEDKKAQRRVDEVNKRLKQIGLQFTGTKEAAWTDERIDMYLGGGWYGADGIPNYAQAHIAYMTPQQYLNLTMGTNTSTVDRIENETAEYGDVDFNKLGDSAPIRLYIDKGRNGARVTGHEGRHRMMMLGRAGFSRVPVLLFDSSDKYEKTTLTNYTLRPQTFGSDKLISRGRNVTLDEMIPFSQGNRDLIKEKFGSGNVDADIRYSRRDTEAGDDFRSIVERNQQREQTRMFLDASADWRQEQTRLDVHKLRGSTEAMLKTYGDKLTKDQREKLVQRVNSLAYDVLRKNGDTFEIEQKATRIAGDIVFQSARVDDKAGRAAMMNDPQTEEAIDYLTNYILASIVSTQTYQGKRLQEQIERNAKLKDTLREVRQKRDAKIREGIESRKRQQTARTDSALRKSILARAKRLKNMKMGQAGKALLQQLIGDMNTDVSHLTEGKIAKIDEVNAWLATQDENNINLSESTKKLLALANQKYLDDIIAKGDVEKLRQLNEALAELEHMVRNQNRLIAENDRRDLREIAYEEADIINNSAGTKEGLFRKMDSVMVQGTLSPMRFVRRLTGYNEKSALYRLAKAIDEGTLKQQDYQMRASKLFDKWMRDRNLTRKWAGKKADVITYDVVTFDGQQKQIQMTPAMRMTLYLASQDAGWMRHMVGADGPDGHIDGAGIHMPNMSSYKKGDMAAAYSAQPDDSHKFRVTKAFLNKIAADLTDEERAFADAAQKFFNGMQKEEINAVSNELVGRDLAVVDNYLPIDVDKNFTGVDYGAIQNDGTVTGIGNLKERQNSGAPVYVRDLTDILIKSINSTSAYVGLAIPIRNMNKLLGVNLGSMTDGGQYLTHETSLNEAIDKKWGQTAKDYINKMLADIQHPVRVQEDLEKAFAKLRSNYARSVLTLNLSVGLKQAASYPTAAAVVGWEALAKAMKDLHKVDLDLIAKYTPLLWYRSRGFINPDLEGIKSQNDFFSNLPKGLDWITGVDFLTTRKLWKAAEYYVRNNQPNLYHKGAGIYGQTDAYNEAVAEVYNRIIEETQPNYTPWQRPQYLRSNSGIVRTLMMFKTQPMQNFNILYDAVGNFKAKQRAMKANSSDPQVQAQFKDASRNLRRAITSQIGQLITFAAMTMAWNLFRRKKEKYEDEEGNFSIETMLKSMGKDIGSGLFGMVPFGADAWSMISSLAFGDKYYGFESVTDSALGDLGSAFMTTWNTISDFVTGKKEFDITSYKKKIRTVGAAVSKIFGIPAENLYNLFTALYMRGRDLTENQYMADYYALAWTEDPAQNQKQFVEIAWQAYNAGDMEAYDEVVQTLTEDLGIDPDKITENMKKFYASQFAADPDNATLADGYKHLYDLYKTDYEAFEAEYNKALEIGFTDEQIKGGIESQMKIEQNVDSVDKLDHRFMIGEDKELFDSITTELHNSSEYKKASSTDKEYMDGLIDKLVTGKTNAWTNARDGIEAGAITAPEYLQFMVELEKANQANPEGSKTSYSKDEQEAAIKAMGWSNKKAKDAWQYLPKGDTKNPFDPNAKSEKKDSKKEETAPTKPVEAPLPVIPQLQDSDSEVTETTSNTASWQGDATYNSMFQMLTIPMSGRTYTYFDVPQEVFEGMKTADNPTSYFNQYIKGAYKYVRN